MARRTKARASNLKARKLVTSKDKSPLTQHQNLITTYLSESSSPSNGPKGHPNPQREIIQAIPPSSEAGFSQQLQTAPLKIYAHPAQRVQKTASPSKSASHIQPRTSKPVRAIIKQGQRKRTKAVPRTPTPESGSMMDWVQSIPASSVADIQARLRNIQELPSSPHLPSVLHKTQDHCMEDEIPETQNAVHITHEFEQINPLKPDSPQHLEPTGRDRDGAQSFSNPPVSPATHHNDTFIPPPDDDDDPFHLLGSPPSPVVAPQTATDRTGHALFEVLSGQFEGCTPEEHSLKLDAHMVAEEDNHHDLSATYATWADHASSNPSHVGLATNSFPSNKGKRRTDFPTDEIFRESFEGTVDPEQPKKNICLHCEDAGDGIPLTSFDIDSLIAFPHSLGAIKQGIEWCPAKDISRNIKTDIHLTQPVSFLDINGIERTHSMQLREIPHLYLGSATGFHGSSVYIFFPKLYRYDQQFKYMKDIECKKFYDHVFYPAIVKFTEQGNLPQYPQSSDIAELNSTAKSSEHSTGRESSGRKVFPRHFIKGGVALQRAWQEMVATCEDERNEMAEFQDAFIMIDMKGEKARYREEGSLYEALIKFQENLEQSLDLRESLMGNVYVDIGRELLGPYTQSLYGDRDLAGDATAYMWKKCCLEKILRRFQHNGFGTEGEIQFYNIGFLRDAACMNVTPPKKSWMYRGGFVYGQFYSSIKQIMDAQKVYPFESLHHEELALDPGMWKTLSHKAHASHVKSRETLVQGFIASKLRSSQALRQSANTSYGSRLEFRVSWELFQCLLRLAREHEQRKKHMPYRYKGHPESVWVVKTAKLTDFFYHTYDKLVSAIEIGISTSPVLGIKLERTRILQAMFQCLRGFFNCNLERYSTLEVTERLSEDGVIERGLGMGASMLRYGFAWFDPKIDWLRLTYYPTHAPEMLGLSRDLVRWYDQHASYQLQDRTEDVHEVLTWLVESRFRTVTAADEAILLLCHLLLQEYRRDTLMALQKDFGLAGSVEADLRPIKFCHEEFSKACVSDIHQVSGNRTAHKAPAEIFTWIWGPSEAHLDKPAYPRRFFGNKSFRIWVDIVYNFTRSIPLLHQRIFTCLQHEFFFYHWLIPYPDINGTLLSTQKKTCLRQFYAVGQKNLGGGHSKPIPALNVFSWLDKKVRKGQPPDYPQVLSISVANLKKKWII